MGDRRIGGHRTEHGRLGPQHGDIRKTVPAQRNRQSHVQQDLTGIVDGPRPPPRRQHRRYRLVKPALRTVSTSSKPPAWETTARSPLSTRTRGYDPILFFTW